MTRKIVSVTVAIIALGLYAALFVYNLVTNKTFFEAPIYHLLNIAVAVVVTYFLVQKKNDKRKLKEIVENIIEKIQQVTDSDDAYIFNENYDRKKVLHMLRSVSNKITILNSLEDKLNIRNEVDKIDVNFKMYKEVIGDYLDDVRNLSSKEVELRKLTGLINNQCDKLRVKLYK